MTVSKRVSAEKLQLCSQKVKIWNSFNPEFIKKSWKDLRVRQKCSDGDAMNKLRKKIRKSSDTPPVLVKENDNNKNEMKLEITFKFFASAARAGAYPEIFDRGDFFCCLCIVEKC